MRVEKPDAPQVSEATKAEFQAVRTRHAAAALGAEGLLLHACMHAELHAELHAAPCEPPVAHAELTSRIPTATIPQEALAKLEKVMTEKMERCVGQGWRGAAAKGFGGPEEGPD